MLQWGSCLVRHKSSRHVWLTVIAVVPMFPVRGLCTSVVRSEPLVDDQVAAGFQHVLALTEGGRAYGWGKGNRGQLGNGAQVLMPTFCVQNRVI
jgi:hypothetical protein